MIDPVTVILLGDELDQLRAENAQQAERIKELERETEEYDAALLATDADEIVKASPTLEVK